MSSILALDLGEKRIGVARAGTEARLAEPLTTLANDSELVSKLKDIIQEHQVITLVIGRPLGMQGQTTAQTETITKMAKRLENELGLKVHWQDETLTSHEAETELHSRGIRYNKSSVDALAACLILEDFLRLTPTNNL
jgi:putative Holliday junction resolvase